jgi:hypothetical protein
MYTTGKTQACSVVCQAAQVYLFALAKKCRDATGNE